MISFLLGSILTGLLVYKMCSVHHAHDLELEEMMFDSLRDDFIHYKQNYEVSKIRFSEKINILESSLKVLEDIINSMKNEDLVYYDQRTNSVFSLSDEEVIQLGEL